MSDQRTGFAEWAHMELMGHRSHHGSVTEVVIAGAAFLRIDIFGIGDEAAREYHLYPPGSLYGLHPSTEARCRLLSTPYADRPKPELGPGVDEDDEDDEDDLADYR